jgi:hypothetical protein
LARRRCLTYACERRISVSGFVTATRVGLKGGKGRSGLTLASGIALTTISKPEEPGLSRRSASAVLMGARSSHVFALLPYKVGPAENSPILEQVLFAGRGGVMVAIRTEPKRQGALYCLMAIFKYAIRAGRRNYLIRQHKLGPGRLLA